ncbi:hypothetical protein [Bosea thiooxidans]|uniref:hypothetical protein n=1 Tax=Bosea thiooxidans TaxID=53254 RepID=UPI0012E18DBC|nr:hypothetical protein [Bosea thiooxidans]
MRKQAIAVITSISLSISGCVSIFGLTKEELDDAIRRGCDFKANSQVLIDLIKEFGGPTVAIASKIADAVCKTVKPTDGALKSPLRDGSYGSVGSVKIFGSFEK